MAPVKSKKTVLKEEILVEPSPDGSKIDLNQAISELTNNGTLVLSEGTFELSKPVDIWKSIKIKGQGKEKTRISGSSLKRELVSSSSNNEILFQGISFEADGKIPYCVSNDGGKLTVFNCLFANKEKNGLEVRGSTLFEISNSDFVNIAKTGFSIIGHSSGSLSRCVFRNSNIGISVNNKSNVNVTNCIFSNQTMCGIEYFDSSRGCCTQNEFVNTGSFGLYASGKSTIVVDNNKFNSCKSGIDILKFCNATITKNFLTGCDIGVHCSDRAIVSIDFNEVFTESVGIMCTEKSDVKIRENTITGISNTGVWGTDKSLLHISKNKIMNNKAAAIFSDQSQFTIEENEILGNKDYGIRVINKAKGVIVNNSFKNNAKINISVEDKASVTCDVEIG